LAVGGLILAAAGLTLAQGCSWTPGGKPYSLDRYAYESTTHTPQTVTLVDTRTLQPLRSWEVPVGKKLVMEFFKDVRGGSPDAPDQMAFDIWDKGDNYGTPNESMFVPPSYARRVDVKARQSPELTSPIQAGVLGNGTLAAPGAPVLPVQQAPVVSAAASAAPVGAAPIATGPIASDPIAPPATTTAATPAAAATRAPAPVATPAPTPAPTSAPAPAPAAVAGQIMAGRYYLVVARLLESDAQRAVGALNASGVAARTLARDGQGWVVVTSPSYSEAEYSHPTATGNKDQLLNKVMAIGQNHQQSGGASNFSMASWELMKP